MMHFLRSESWDFFHVHIMETDRLNHFLLHAAGDEGDRYSDAFYDVYRKIDRLAGELIAQIGSATPLAIISDHGFCPIRYEVQLSRYLADKGWTAPAAGGGPLPIDPLRSKAFCLIPGRIYVNLAGREPQGIVPAEEFNDVRAAITADLMALSDPQGRPVMRAVLKREDVYWPEGADRPGGLTPSAHDLSPYRVAPDLIAVPRNGYDLKMGLAAKDLFTRTELQGMHTYEDAVFAARGLPPPAGDLEIRQLGGWILQVLGVPIPGEMDVAAVPSPLPAELAEVSR
jgi:predicted AlkP superfamily phosphohydrolase/phosphomutase